jgi:hypothetical protein
MGANTTPFFREKHVHISGLLTPCTHKKNESHSDSLKTLMVLSSHHATGGLPVSPDVPEIDQPE